MRMRILGCTNEGTHSPKSSPKACEQMEAKLFDEHIHTTPGRVVVDVSTQQFLIERLPAAANPDKDCHSFKGLESLECSRLQRVVNISVYSIGPPAAVGGYHRGSNALLLQEAGAAAAKGMECEVEVGKTSLPNRELEGARDIRCCHGISIVISQKWLAL